MAHVSFWWEFVGKIGAPIFAATLVGCLLAERFDVMHAILMVLGVLMMGLSHWRDHHRQIPGR